MLLFIGFLGLLGLTIIAIVFCMVILGLSYFFIKRARLYFNTLKELKKVQPFHWVLMRAK
ncbi:putative membrane protein YqhA [Bartonella callosciuri]|uniref:Putative membrane protein YqhA n=1 Tax=Bartonella callosciuri TaxID=686223 RepID=A0A840NTS2_9HYPH|nr:putative membrane protein YqhA [Bartonella callosciuri]